jgi:hypothetical protein
MFSLRLYSKLRLSPGGIRCSISLDLVESGDVDGLDVILELADLLLKLINTDFVILNNAADLELVDSVGERDELADTPQEAVHFDGSGDAFQLLHVGFIIPRLDVEEDGRLGNECWFLGLLF